MRKLIIGLLLLMILPAISADVIIPGYHPIQINNKIANIVDFPNYVFVSAPDNEFGPGYGMCPITLVNEGYIYGGYKFCSISVYAIEKNKINLNDFNEFGSIELDELGLNETEMNKYFLTLNPVKVLSNIEHYREVVDSDTINIINNYYTVSLDSVKTEPDNIEIKRDYTFYFYIITSLVALAIIIGILIKRKK